MSLSRAQTWLIRAAVLALVLFFGARFFWRLDWQRVWQAVAHAPLWTLGLGTLANLPLGFTKALRLRLITQLATPLRHLMGFFFASYAADNLLMSQAGVGLRVALLKREGMNLASAVAVQVVEKLLEAGVL